MPRGHRTDNVGMHQIDHGPQRFYGKCHQCNQTQPIYWVSRTRCLCRSCMKATGAQPFHPTIPPTSSVAPPTRKNRNRRKLPALGTRTAGKITYRYKEPTLHSPQDSPEKHSAKQRSRMENTQQDQPAPVRISKKAVGQNSSSPGATPETLSRWERNQLAVKRAREHRLAQEP